MGSMLADGYTFYTIEVCSPDGSSWDIQRRYREFRELHDSLFSFYGEALPEMPGKRIFGNQDPTFVIERQVALESYLQRVLQLECRACRALSPQTRQFLGLERRAGEGYSCKC